MLTSKAFTIGTDAIRLWVIKALSNLKILFICPLTEPLLNRGNLSVVEPQNADHLSFNVRREVPDEEGVLNAIMGEDTTAGAFRINI